MYTNKNEGITFEELCKFCDSIEVEESVDIDNIEIKQKQEKEKSNVLVYKHHIDIDTEVLHKEWEISFKVKKMSTSKLKSIFRSYRNYECNDRQTLIHVVCIILSSNEYKEEVSKRTYYVTLLDKVEINKLSWSEIREIRRLYNIKQNDSKDSCYSFKEIGDLYNISHIFTRNICLGKVYKDKKS